IGPPASKDSYLSMPTLIAACEITNADAIHPGYGFLSENAEFSRICAENGIKFIGASPEMINQMGDKATAKATMIKAGVPVVPGSVGLLDSVEQGKKLANKIKYPVIIKATAGGGGRGMRVINSDDEFQKAWDDARTESKAAFGNDGMYLEKYVVEPRHIEIQIVGDQFGHVCHLSERDCSIQRRHQKLVEEAPSPFMTDKLREAMGKAAIKGAASIGYEGVGTIEFLVDKNRDFYFMEMNTRIQVEHPVTEMITGVDLVKEQIRVAAGEPLSIRELPPLRGHVIECRVNAEDPNRNFQPSPGKITTYHPPGGNGVRIDSHVYAGYSVPPYYDSMIAKVICQGRDRPEALAKMQLALETFIIEGPMTTIPFLARVMQNPRFQSGNVDTRFLEREPELMKEPV
ncbi:MAG: acetyl-CoA carboxylase biotin carboxylase subunit, partial [Polaromonas sp.]|nr:acetyl-CoA carboxylase biotin carboxylase subunit [Gemmatimonadaceae bacterium]